MSLKKLTEEVLSKLDLDAFFRERAQGFRKEGKQYKALCPFTEKHTDTQGSLSINTQEGLFYCHGCHSKGNAISFHYKTGDFLTYRAALLDLAQQLGIDTKSFEKKKIPPKDIGNYHQTLLKTSDDLYWLVKTRKINLETIDRFKIGLNKKTNRFTIPIYDQDGDCINLRLYNPKAADNKMINTSGHGKPCLYGLPDLLKYPSDKPVIICEGEWDRLVLVQAGFPAVTTTNGAGSFQDWMAPYFKDRDVVLVYDADPGGRAGAKNTAKLLAPVVRSLKIVDLDAAGLVGGTKESNDISDLARSRDDWPQALQKVVDDTAPVDLEAFKKEAEKTDRSSPMYCPGGFALTDLGNAERFVGQHKEYVRYCPQWGKWLRFENGRWARDDVGATKLLAIDTVRSIYIEAGNAADSEDRKALAKHAKNSESKSRIEAMTDLAKVHLPIVPAEMDKDPWLLNVENGTIDLRTGILHPHDKDQYHSKIVPIKYDPKATAPVWNDFLKVILKDDMELIGFVQRAMGYSLTGSTREQCLFLLHGTGQNGKTTFINVLMDVAGDYAKQASFTTFLEQQKEAPRNDIADLFGARIVAALEAKAGRSFDEEVIKQLTGEDMVKARFLYQEHFEFKPEFKIWLAANHQPYIKAQDYAIWRRIRLIPFDVTIKDVVRPDPKMPQKLQAELPGVLTWAVQGCLEWQSRGLDEPEIVRVATDAYKTDMDTLWDFIQDRCTVNVRAWVATSDIYEEYCKWCEDNREKAMTKRWFVLKLKERGFKNGRTKNERRWYGIGLKAKGFGNYDTLDDSNDANDGESQNTHKDHYQEGFGDFTLNTSSSSPNEPLMTEDDAKDVFSKKSLYEKNKEKVSENDPSRDTVCHPLDPQDRTREVRGRKDTKNTKKEVF